MHRRRGGKPGAATAPEVAQHDQEGGHAHQVGQVGQGDGEGGDGGGDRRIHPADVDVGEPLVLQEEVDGQVHQAHVGEEDRPDGQQAPSPQDRQVQVVCRLDVDEQVIPGRQRREREETSMRRMQSGFLFARASLDLINVMQSHDIWWNCSAMVDTPMKGKWR